MKFEGKIVTRSTNVEPTITVNKSGSIKFSTSVTNQLNIIGGQVGFAYSEDGTEAHLYSVTEGGCAVSKQGGISSAHHRNTLSDVFNNTEDKFKLNVNIGEPTEHTDGTTTYTLYSITPTWGEDITEVVEVGDVDHGDVDGGAEMENANWDTDTVSGN